MIVIGCLIQSLFWEIFITSNNTVSGLSFFLFTHISLLRFSVLQTVSKTFDLLQWEFLGFFCFDLVWVFFLITKLTVTEKSWP